MKKLALAMGIAAACSLPMTAVAGTNLYGALKYSFNSIDEDRTRTLEGGEIVPGIDGWQGDDNVSLLGLKGSYGDKTKAFFHLQTGAKADGFVNTNAFDQRFYFGGLSGGWGKLAYGRMTNSYKFPGFKLDPFYNLSGINAAGSYSRGGATYGLSPATNGFTNNALQYVTPSLGGLKLNAGTYIDDSNADKHGYTVGGEWNGSGFKAGLVYASSGDGATLPGIVAGGTGTRGYASYGGDAFNVAASYESIEQIISAIDNSLSKNSYFYLTGTWKAKSINTDFKGSWGSVEKGLTEGNSFVIGAFNHVTDMTQVYLTYSKADLEVLNSEPSVFSVGAIHKF
jgi:hypothetical protein